MSNRQEQSQGPLPRWDLTPAENSLPTGSPPLNGPPPNGLPVNRKESNPSPLSRNQQPQNMNSQNQNMNNHGKNMNSQNQNMNNQGKNMNNQPQNPQETEQNDSEMKRRKDALDLWRSLKDVNANLPEDLIGDELTAASDATDLQTKSVGDCWLRSRCPMPRLRISDGVSERLIPWYSILEVHVDSTFRIFELYLAGDVVCRIISRRPQQELYANLQLERVKVIYPVASVSVRFEDLKEKKPGPV